MKGWEKISYERRVYESVEVNSLSYALSQRPTKKEVMQQWVKQNEFLFNLFSPLLHIDHYSKRLIQISNVK